MEKGQWLRQLLSGVQGPGPKDKGPQAHAAEGCRGLGQGAPGPRADTQPLGIHTRSLVLSSAASHHLLPPWTSQDAYSEIAYLFAEFFRDLDIVPSDIIAGLVLLRQRQRAKRNAVLDEVGARPSPKAASLQPSLPRPLAAAPAAAAAAATPSSRGSIHPLGSWRPPLDAHSTPIPAATTVALT